MKKEIVNAYAPFDDMTFIMEETYAEDGRLLSIECIGWYCGEPDEEANKTFAHQLKGIYDDAEGAEQA